MTIAFLSLISFPFDVLGYFNTSFCCRTHHFGAKVSECLGNEVLDTVAPCPTLFSLFKYFHINFLVWWLYLIHTRFDTIPAASFQHAVLNISYNYLYQSWKHSTLCWYNTGFWKYLCFWMYDKEDVVSTSCNLFFSKIAFLFYGDVKLFNVLTYKYVMSTVL